MVRKHLKNNIPRIFLKGKLKIFIIALISVYLVGCSDSSVFSRLFYRLFYVLDHESEFSTISIERAAKYDGFKIIRCRKILMFGFKGPPSSTERLDLNAMRRISSTGRAQINMKIERGKVVSVKCMTLRPRIGDYVNEILSRMRERDKYTDFFERVEMVLRLDIRRGTIAVDFEKVSVKQPQGPEGKWICYTINIKKGAAKFLFPQHGFDVSIGSTDREFKDMKKYEKGLREG